MPPLDFTTLLVPAAMVVSLIAGRPACYGDLLTLHINVAPPIVASGLDGPTAEQTFVAESARIVRGVSIIPTPTLQVNLRPTVVSALVVPLQLDSVVGALQDQFGYDRVVANGSVMSGAAGPQRMVIVVEQPRQTPDQIQLTQADGDPIALVRRGANATLARISPYRVAEAHYTQGLENNDP